MNIPTPLKNGIEELINSVGLNQLIQAREKLTERYRIPHQKQPYIATESERIAYLATRMPATYAAVHAVLTAVKTQTPDFAYKQLLDLGSGPGTAMWAAANIFNSLEQATLIEQDAALAKLGQSLAKTSDDPVIQQGEWIIANIETFLFPPGHDLVIFSYSLGELTKENLMKTIDAAWNATTQVLIVIEPGTPLGFERIRMIRQHLINQGAFMVAPCPHEKECPIVGDEWCHFSERLERSSFHKLLKGGSLGYEDEKYSYIAVSKEAVLLPKSRVLKDPDRHSGHLQLTLCAENGIEKQIISKKRGELYKIAKKLAWGSPFSP